MDMAESMRRFNQTILSITRIHTSRLPNAGKGRFGGGTPVPVGLFVTFPEVVSEGRQGVDAVLDLLRLRFAALDLDDGARHRSSHRQTWVTGGRGDGGAVCGLVGLQHPQLAPPEGQINKH